MSIEYTPPGVKGLVLGTTLLFGRGAYCKTLAAIRKMEL